MGAGGSKTKETHLKMEKLRSPMRLCRKLSGAVCLENGQKKYVTAVLYARSPQIVENVWDSELVFSSVNDRRGVWVVLETYRSSTSIRVYFRCSSSCSIYSLLFQRYPNYFLNWGTAKSWCLFDRLHEILSHLTFIAKWLIFQACFSLSEPSFNELSDDMIIGWKKSETLTVN